MQEILTQKFNFARIIAYKDYCKLEEKQKLKKSMNENLDDYDYDVDTIQNSLSILQTESTKKEGRITRLPENKKRGNIFYFSTKDEIQESFIIQYAYINSKTNNSFETQKDYQIKRHYGRPFSSIETHTIERKIKIENNKLSIKLYSSNKVRGFNCIHFKKTYFVHSVSFDLSNGNFIVTKVTKSGKKSTKSFRKNSFKDLENILKGYGLLKVTNCILDTKSELHKQFVKEFDDEIFIQQLRKHLNVEHNITLKKNEISNVIFLDYLNFFINLKKIKIPNGNYVYWIKYFYPTEKYLKKNDRKLIASILDMVNLKSKITIRLLHEYPTLDLVSFKWICDYFGSDYPKYISNIKNEIFENSIKKTENIETVGKYNILFNVNRPTIEYILNDIEKENLIKIINSTTYKNNDIFESRFVTLLDDHFSMINRLKDYFPDLHMKSKTYDDFHVEHRELTKMISSIKKGWVTEYKFGKKLISEIEIPIEIKFNLGTIEEPVWTSDLENKKFLYPYILKREEDYDEEGSFMHHCVASYSNKEKSIIISVRNESGSDRVTCEFDIQTGRCIQQRHFCNAVPPKEFEYVLLKLVEIVKRHSNYGTLNWIEKNRVPVKINGLEIKPEERQPRRLGDIFDFF